MIKVTLAKNIFSDSVSTKEYAEGTSLRTIIEENYSDMGAVETYHPKTGETTFEVYDQVFAISVNDKEEKNPDYTLKENDSVVIITVPKVATTITAIAGATGALVGTALAWALGAAVVFDIAMFVAIGIGLVKAFGKQDETTESKDLNKALDTRGAVNTSILTHPFPVVLGTHFIAPYIMCSPYNEIPMESDTASDNIGSDNYVHIVYCAGYAPLKLTEFRLGDLLLAHNQSNSLATRDTVLHGTLKGYVDDDNDSGDILRRWKNNDVTLEILQSGGSVGSVYPQAVIQTDVNAKPLFILDGDLNSITDYKGVPFKSGYRNNTVRFSDHCPMAIEIEMDAENGLYRTRNETVSHGTWPGDWKTTGPTYGNFKVCYAVQYRLYKKSNPSSDAESGAGWTTFMTCNTKSGGAENHTPYDSTNPEAYFELYDYWVNSSNNLSMYGQTGVIDYDKVDSYNKGWRGYEVFNLQPWGGEKNGAISEVRFVFRVEFTIEQMMQIAGLTGTDADADLDSVELRVIRINPNYYDAEQIDNNSTTGPYSYNDIVKWTCTRTEKFDKKKLKALVDSGKTASEISRDEIKLSSINEDDLKKFCFVAMKIKTDKVGELGSQIKKFSCVASNFVPQLLDNGTFTPSIERKGFKYYYQLLTADKDDFMIECTKDEYDTYVTQPEVYKVRKTFAGNNYHDDFYDLLGLEIDGVPVSSYDGHNVIMDEVKEKYVNNATPYQFLYTMIGPHLGKEAYGYSDINMLSVRDAINYCPVSDGTMDEDKNLVELTYTCNGYVTENVKLSDLIAKVLATTGAGLTLDGSDRYKIVVDKVRDYPVMLINDQNVISSSFTRSYKEDVSGYHVTFKDENDQFNDNTMYVMDDNEDQNNPTGDITETQIPYVTNVYNMYSLLRRAIAQQKLQKEVVEVTLGLAGFSVHLYDLIAFQSPGLLIGQDGGARIRQLIQDSDKIYGFITDDLYTYEGELDSNGKCTQGVMVFQPGKSGKSKVVTLRLHTPTVQAYNVQDFTVYPGSPNLRITLDGIDVELTYERIHEGYEGDEIYYVNTTYKHFNYKFRDLFTREANVDGTYTYTYTKKATYKLAAGKTNIVLFDDDDVILKASSSKSVGDNLCYEPQLDDMVAFGIYNKIVSYYTVQKIEPQENFKFKLTLWQYDKDVYQSGKNIPVLQNNMTVPNDMASDDFVLDESLHQKDVTQVNFAQSIADSVEAAKITNVETYYYADSQNTTKPDYDLFTSDPLSSSATMTPSNRYLWTYIKYIYEDETYKTTDRYVTGVYGQQGEAGTGFLFDISPESMNLTDSFMNETGSKIEILAALYKDDQDYTNTEECSVVAKVNGNIIGTWIEKDTSNYGRRVTINCSDLPKGTDSFTVVIECTYQQSDGTTLLKNALCNVSRYYNADSSTMYKLIIDSSSIKKDRSTGVYDPSEINVEKHKINTQGESPTEKGYVTVEYDDSGVEEKIDNYVNQKGQTYSSENQYYILQSPFVLRIDEDSDIVIGNGFDDSNSAVGGVFYD